ncbi:MAG: hypothetical protein ACRC20_02005 [Segniliparus sp.]|uniref:hypothetical protein n=1 Tax=Segniliparus sp. TaxID=2804064 RepID=UPI003F36E542
MELKAMRRPVSATCLHPGFILTDIISGFGDAARVTKRIAPFVPKLYLPSTVGKRVVKGILKDKARVYCGLFGRSLPIVGSSGSWYFPIVSRITRQVYRA